MFNNDSLPESFIDAHKKSENTSLSELGFIPQSSKPTVCSKDEFKRVDKLVPSYLGKTSTHECEDEG